MALENAPALAEHAVEQASFLATLGIDWKLFLAQLVNFSIIAIVFWRWGYRPLVAMLEQRRQRIEQGIADAAQAEADRANAAREREQIVLDARKESKTLVEAGRTLAEQQRADAVLATKRETAKIVDDARTVIARERDRMHDGLRAELATLLCTAAEHVLREKIDAKKDRALIAAAVENVER